MAPLSRLLLLALLAASALAAVLAAPLPLRVHPVDEDEGAAADMGEGDDGDDASAEADSSATRPVAILEHRQELQDDGTFNYAFSADNGLTQNEAFHPDGSRTGSYSYVDPKGETILVKYRADRFGFHVLDGSSIPSTPPHTVNTPNAAPSAPRGASQQASSDYGHGEGVQAVLDPNYFSFPGSGLGPGLGHGLGNLKTASSKSSGKLHNKGAKGRGAGAKGNLKASGKAVGGRARSSASSSMHYLQREARQAFVSDLDGDMMHVDGDGQESRLAYRAVRPPPAMLASSTNDVDSGAGGAEGMAAADDGNYEHHALKYDDGSYEPHAMKYDDGSYEPHAAKYDDGSYEPHAAKYDDGSYEPHAAKYDDGSYVKHVGNYDDGSYEPHAAKYDDGSYEKYAKLYDDGSYKHSDHDKGAEGDGEGDAMTEGQGEGYY